MHLLRCMVFAEARLQCSLAPTYIETKANHLADDLSRNNISSFLFKVPSAKKHPSPVSAPLLDLLLDQPTRRLDLPELAPALQKYFQAGLAQSNQKTYGAAMKRFYQFCFSYTIPDPFPVSELTLCYFVSYLAEQGLAPQTGRAYLAAVRNAQISLGLQDPREQSSLPLLK